MREREESGMLARYLVQVPERWELPFTETEDIEGRAAVQVEWEHGRRKGGVLFLISVLQAKLTEVFLPQ